MRQSDRAHPVLARRRLDLADLVVDAFVESVDLGEQHRGRIGRVARVGEGLDRADDPLIHHLERRRHDPAGDDRRDGRRAVLDAREVQQQRPDGRGIGVSRTQTAVTTPSVPSDPTTTPRRS